MHQLPKRMGTINQMEICQQRKGVTACQANKQQCPLLRIKRPVRAVGKHFLQRHRNTFSTSRAKIYLSQELNSAFAGRQQPQTYMRPALLA